MRASLILLAIVLAGIPAGGLQIVEFCPDPYLKGEGDAYVVIAGSGPLDGVTLEDGEGILSFPPGTRIRGRITIAAEGPAFLSTYGVPPDFEILNTSAGIPDMRHQGMFAMANRADQLILKQGNLVLQEVRWPEEVAAREGQIHYLENGTWDPRPRFPGQSGFLPAEFPGATITAFVSPGGARVVLLGAIRNASREILVSTYELEDAGIARELAGAQQRGVRVEVLLEGGPAGGISPGGRGAALLLNRSGIPVSVMATTDAAHARYRFTHAKVVVLDSTRVIVGTENLNPTGYPAPGEPGNRGWGVLIEDPETAGYFRDVYLHDRSGGDILPFTPEGEAQFWDPGPLGATAPPAPATRTFQDGIVRPVLAPDTAFLVEALIAGANRSVDIEVASIRNSTGDRLNPYLLAAVDASRRGVAVRILLDGSSYGTGGDQDNDEMAAVIAGIARREGLPLEVRVGWPADLGVRSIHNKGVIVDSRRVLVSSINWNENSPAFNREAGVILEHPGVAGFFTEAFVQDWNRAAGGFRTDETVILRWAVAVLVFCLLFGMYLVRRRW
ncbi:MAG: phospholipase D-like domain-containing protein [Methanomicrobiales archaeon]|nr:phospholipase D-like domain-containing protein [Methanomicrobiales archaeon]